MGATAARRLDAVRHRHRVAGRARARNTAYFAWTPALEVLWLSDPAARHSRNLRASSTAAIAVYDSSQSWGEPDRGLQLFGSAREVGRAARPEAERDYVGRFPQFAEADATAMRLYRFRPSRLKLFDEPALGAGVFVTARVDRGGRVAWERTEIYREGGPEE
jgi:uncharacterized protein YhbP (UPF0306 family)